MNLLPLLLSSRRYTFVFLTITLFFWTSWSFSQNASAYSFQALSGTYAALAGTNVGGLTATGDDEISSTTNIGFTFKFAGIDYTQLKVSSNGWLTFNTSVVTSEPLNAWAEMNVQRPTIFPLWDDLQNRVIPRYTVSGAVGSRIFKLEWFKSEWNKVANNDVISFQVWLYETTNQIDFIYSQGGTAVSAGSASIGIFDHNGKHLALDGSGASPIALNSLLTTNINAKPANGQIYRFTPPQFNSQFISMNTGAQVWCPGETRNVSVTVKNVGTTSWSDAAPDINIGVKWNSDANFTIKTDANGLAYGATQAYSFNVTAPTTAGVHYLLFDVINETVGCEFGGNSGPCKADNFAYPSNHIIVKEFPPVNAGSDVAICGGSITLNGASSGVFDPVVIYSEDFESYVDAELPVVGTSWRQKIVSGTSTVDWQTKASCDPVIGSKCLNTNDGWTANPADCDYRWGNASNKIAWFGTKINATGYSNIKLNFRWKGYGEASYDYGKVVYSLDGTTWFDLVGVYGQQLNWTTAFNISLPSTLDNNQFYLGFRWINDAASGAAPGFCIDDILVIGNSPTAQPVTVLWSPAATLSNPNIVNPVATPVSTTTYTITANSSGCTTTDQVVVTVDSPSTAPTSITGGGTYCVGNEMTLSKVGGALAGSATYEWFTGSCGGTSAGSGASITVSPTVTTTYYVRASVNGACPATTCSSITVTMPTKGTTLSLNTDMATCPVNGNNWIFFYHSSGRYIGAIHPQGQNLGMVDMTSYVSNVPDVDACGFIGNPLYKTSLMDRRWVVSPAIQPGSNVNVQLPFLNAELADLSASSWANANAYDNVSVINEVVLSRYHGPSNVNNQASDNCTATGGNQNTTLHPQTANGNLASVLTGFVNTSYTQYTVPQFSELWLHGSSNMSPLPIELTSFNANCDEAKNEVLIYWSTASENNTSYFDVERSEDGIVWEKIGSINAAGNSTVSQVYQLTDKTLRAVDMVYYRLQQHDVDGESKSYGPVVASCINSENGFELFPNPAGNDVTIVLHGDYDKETTQLLFLDMNGKEVKKVIFDGKTGKLMTVDLRNLETGVYIVRLLDNEMNSQFVRMIKQ